jgi:peptidase E
MTGLTIVAMGGGGCTNHADPLLDDWIFALLGKLRPRIGFLGTASDNAPDKLRGFHAAFAERAEIAPLLPEGASAQACAAWLHNLDMVYVGGGNMLRLRREWDKSDWVEPLAAAARRGLTIAGVSAGAMCWFEQGFSKAESDHFRAVSGLGLVPGSCCPHFSEEPERKPAFEAALLAGTIVTGIAIDDGVAVLCTEAGPHSYFTARTGHAAYRFTLSNGVLASAELPSWRSEG